MKEYKKYSDIPVKYRFDLEYLLEGKTIESLIEEMDKYTVKLLENKEKQYETIEAFLDYKKAEEEFGIYFGKVYNFLANKKNINLIDPAINKLNSDFFFKYSQFTQALGSEENRFFKNYKKMQEWIKDPRLANYKKSIEAVLESKKHKLNNEVEEYLVQTARAEVSLSETFSILRDSETKFEAVVDSKGKKHNLTVATYSKLLKNKDEQVRKNAYNNFLNGYNAHKQTFSSLLFQHIKKHSVRSKARNYQDSIDAFLDNDHSSVKLLNIIFKSIKKHKNLFGKFNKEYKKFFKTKFNKTMEKWDTSLPLVKIKESYEVEEAQELLLKAIQPLGEKYSNQVKKALEERWVDYYNVPNKRTGAYSIGAHYGLDKKYILMNFDGTLRAVSTLAHEMGHSMHSYYSDEKQPFSLASYPIFLAEIASIFNELMLLDHLLSNNNNDVMKFSLLQTSIEDFMATVVRQAQWAEYELNLYQHVDQGKSLSSFEEFEQIYVDTLNTYSDKNNQIKIGNKRNIYAVTVPHFYYGYYVYKYSVGYIVANIFFQKYKEEGRKALDEYIERFLSAGGSDWPIEILKNAGIDLYDESVYEKAFDILNDKINQWIKLGKKIFKNK